MRALALLMLTIASLLVPPAPADHGTRYEADGLAASLDEVYLVHLVGEGQPRAWFRITLTDVASGAAVDERTFPGTVTFVPNLPPTGQLHVLGYHAQSLDPAVRFELHGAQVFQTFQGPLAVAYAGFYQGYDLVLVGVGS